MEKIFVDLLPNWVETNLQPAFYDLESGTVLQMVARMYPKVQELNKAFNDFSEENVEVVNNYINAFNELHDFVEDYFDNLDVQEEVNTKLDAMAEDGTLAEIINEQLFNEMKQQIDEGLKESPAIRPEYLITRYKTSGTATEYDATEPHEQEGICYVGDNKYVTFYSPNTAGITTTSNCIIEEIDFTTKEVVRSSEMTGLMHANACAFDGENIYVAPSQYYNGSSSVSVNKIIIINYETLEKTLEVSIPSINSVAKIALFNNELYVLGDGHLWKVNKETWSAEQLFAVSETGSQGIEVRNNKLYIIRNYPFVLDVYNLENGVKEKTINIDHYTSEGHYIEWLADLSFIDNENILITPHTRGDRTTYTNKARFSYYINYVCKLNLFGNNIQSTKQSSLYVRKEIFVDTTSPESVTFANGSSNNPLKLISECINNEHFAKERFTLESSQPLTYYGELCLDNTSVSMPRDLTCSGLHLVNSTLACYAITVNDKPINIRASKVTASTMTLNYSGDESHLVYYSEFDVNNIPSAGTKKFEFRGSNIVKPIDGAVYYNNNSKIAVRGSLSLSGNTVTVTFDKISSSNLILENYIVAIGLTTGAENIYHHRVFGLGNNRRTYDHNGHYYELTNYTASTQSLTIKSDNASDIQIVTLIAL